MTGTVCVKEAKIEWKIDDFLRLEDNVCSPEFSFSDASWEMVINPFRRDGATEYIGLDLFPVSLPKPLTANMTLSFKTVEEKSDVEDTLTRLIDRRLDGFIRPQMILRSDFIERQSELLPSGALTVICTLKQGEPSVVNECKLPDASTQTEEGTGIWKLQQHLREISLNGDASDVILKVEDQEFKSHRCILAARSPVFSAMMKNEMKENVTGVVDIKDADSKTFSYFLNYLYTGRTEDLTPENVSKVYTVADKYQVDVLKESCLDYMLVNVCVENF